MGQGTAEGENDVVKECVIRGRAVLGRNPDSAM